jgi:hypothetical protein
MDGCIQGVEKFSSGKLHDAKHFFMRGETFTEEFKLFCSMSNTKKIMIGVGLASGALLATWLLTGSRKQKTKEFVSKRAEDLKKVFKTDKNSFDDNEAHYV